MASGITKYAPINGYSDMKPHFSIFRTKKTAAFAYTFLFVFIACTIFIAFTPSSNSSSPWFTNIFSLSSGTNSSASDDSYRSNFSSVYSFFFSNSSSSSSGSNGTLLPFEYQPGINYTAQLPKPSTDESVKNGDLQDDKVGVLEQNQTAIDGINSTVSVNETVNSSLGQEGAANDDKAGVLMQNQTAIDANKTASPSPVPVIGANDDKAGVWKENKTAIANSTVSANSTVGSSPKPVIVGNGAEVKNLTSSLMKKQGSGGGKEKQGSDDLVKSLMNCDFFDGNWVTDESYPLYKPGSCALIDEQFNCFINGRPDKAYYQLKWKPKGCTLPRLDGSHMLEMLRGKRLVFVGDSLNRNMWESLICILRNSVKDQKKVYEQSGRHHFRSEASYSFVFEDYKFTVEFFVSPFLVQEWETVDRSGKKKETLRLDLVSNYAKNYKTADIIVFNTGHWWTHEKTAKGMDYYQEGTHVYRDLNVQEAFRKALTTWGRWVDSNVNPKKSLVFFRGYSASHFSGGQWNSGGACDHETEPIKNETYLTNYPPKMKVLEKVLKGMKTSVTYLNITRLTDYRKDGHPSVYRKQHLTEQEIRSPLRFQDCSHWCLPGVPDSWNEILYAELLVKMSQQRQQNNKS